MTRTLVVGGDSAIGRAAAAELRRTGHETIVTSRRPESASHFLDLQDHSSFAGLPDAEAVVICAAVARLKDCADDPMGSRRVNVEGVVALTRMMRARGASCLFLSTNQVLAGNGPKARTDEIRSPATEYGRQKADAERGVLAAGGAVLRFAKVIDVQNGLFAAWADALRADRTIEAFDDMTLSPILLDDAARAITGWVQRSGDGIYQLSGAEDLTYYAFAIMLAQKFQGAEEIVRRLRGHAAALLGGTEPPRFTSLDSSRCAIELGVGAPTAQETVERVASRLQASR